MTERISEQELVQVATVGGAPPRARVDRNFGLPTSIYVATAAMYLGFIGLMAIMFNNPGLTIPLVICAVFIVIFFGVCGIWTRMAPDNDSVPLTDGQFASRGIETWSGRLTAREAAVQVLILPAVVLLWGLIIGVIVALT